MVVQPLIAEEDKLSHDLERLEFAETKAAERREGLKGVCWLYDAADPVHRGMLSGWL